MRFGFAANHCAVSLKELVEMAVRKEEGLWGEAVTVQLPCRDLRVVACGSTHHAAAQ